MEEIANHDLILANIPTPEADWQTITEFSLTYDGYEVWGSFEKCAKIANARKAGTLTELRTCLFFEQRRYHHFGEKPDDESMVYIRTVIDKIRTKIAAGEFD